ncbi:BTB/POZ domain-containing protein 6-B isoform X2 [Cephus cinctus]|uniref:BTB/POZ domain-containing protein 6-B isoform X2 n=1 Tax=Cephus cinctus TaxID=211228 RepID=A0AAJ7CFX5_CEPCN|nr:BTB/POZ domain-containing protein 6-B isoform X2 [Cephus cinctus]
MGVWLVVRRAGTKGDSLQCPRTELERARDKDKIREGLRYRNHPRPRLIIPKNHCKDFDMSQVALIPGEEKMSGSHPFDMVMLEVGIPGDTWRYRIERQRLAQRSEWFRAMLLGPLSPAPTDPPPTVKLQHIEKRAFDHLLRYLHDEPVNFQSVTTARATLDAAHQYLCPELARLSVKFLEANLDSSTVLEVYQGLGLYAGNLETVKPPGTPTAPPAPGDDVGEIAEACSGLLSACISIIDSDPATVLCQECFEDLSSKEVADLACRDSLRLAHEGTLFAALERWAASECRRRGLDPTAFNKRASLPEEVWYSVRYPLMNDREFIEGPMASGILTSEESAFLVGRILGHTEEKIPVNGPLSRISSVPRAGTNLSGITKWKTSKPGKKEREENKRNRRKECASQGQKACARIGDCLVRVLACVFD